MRKGVNKKAAIELSIGTIVIIVLAVTMLILGIVLVRTILTTTQENVVSIDRGVKNEINKIFSENDDRALVLLPETGIVILKQGESGPGFALSIKNTDTGSTASNFGYDITLEQDDTLLSRCGTSDPLANGVNIIAGKSVAASSTGGIPLRPDNQMDNPAFVRFEISPVAPICTFRLRVNVYKGSNTIGNIYTTSTMDIQITGK